MRLSVKNRKDTMLEEGEDTQDVDTQDNEHEEG